MMQKKRIALDRTSFISNKGQVTIFIILGILMLLAIILVITLKQEITTTKPEEVMPLARGRVEQLISSCISDIGEEALFRLGQQGGYIEVPPDLANDGSVHLRISPFLVVPYWAVGKESFTPTLGELKQRIDWYIEANLRECVLGLTPFQEEYDIIEKSSVDADTEIVNSRVIFNVRWNIEAKNKAGETITEVLNHVADSPIRLKTTYEIAAKIVEKELQEMKLEDITQDLIALEHPEVPVAGIELSCDRKTWEVGKAKERLQDMLRFNIRKLQVNGTEVLQVPSEWPYYKHHYSWNLGDDVLQPELYPEIHVSFTYQNNYPFSFQVTPAEGNLMRSGLLGGTDILSNLCLQIWKFTYDVMYPVLVRVTDETSGYTFQMAFTVHVVRNIPNREQALIPARAGQELSFNVDEEYCFNAKVPMTVQTWEFVENEQGVHDQQPLDGVNVQFSCLKAGCAMGTTSFNFADYGFASGITTNFPYCVGAIIHGQKEGFKEDWKRVVTKSGEIIDLNLVPLQQFPVAGLKIVKHEFQGADKPLGAGRAMDDDEIAIIRLTNFKQGKQFHRIEQAVGKALDPGEARKLNINPTFPLLAKADFPYIVDVQVFRGEELIGGYQQNWILPWDKLEGAQEMTFHVVTQESGTAEGRFIFIQGLPTLSSLVPAPELK